MGPPARPLVQELSSSEATPAEPTHELQIGADVLTLRVELPRLRTAAELEVDVGPRKLSLFAEGVYRLQLPLPQAIDADGARCRFDKKHRRLTITMPLAAS